MCTKHCYYGRPYTYVRVPTCVRLCACVCVCLCARVLQYSGFIAHITKAWLQQKHITPMLLTLLNALTPHAAYEMKNTFSSLP